MVPEEEIIPCPSPIVNSDNHQPCAPTEPAPTVAHSHECVDGYSPTKPEMIPSLQKHGQDDILQQLLGEDLPEYAVQVLPKQSPLHYFSPQLTFRTGFEEEEESKATHAAHTKHQPNTKSQSLTIKSRTKQAPTPTPTQPDAKPLPAEPRKPSTTSKLSLNNKGSEKDTPAIDKPAPRSRGVVIQPGPHNLKNVSHLNSVLHAPEPANHVSTKDMYSTAPPQHANNTHAPRDRPSDQKTEETNRNDRSKGDRSRDGQRTDNKVRDQRARDDTKRNQHSKEDNPRNERTKEETPKEDEKKHASASETKPDAPKATRNSDDTNKERNSQGRRDDKAVTDTDGSLERDERNRTDNKHRKRSLSPDDKTQRNGNKDHHHSESRKVSTHTNHSRPHFKSMIPALITLYTLIL